MNLMNVVADKACEGSLVPGTKDIGGGFLCHGVAVPVSTQRGTVATHDGNGHDIVLSWLQDHRGCYELLLVDINTQKSEEYPVPFPIDGAPFASILSSANKYYTHINSHFVEFDPEKRAYTFVSKTFPQMAMSMTEDDNGVIWSAAYPSSSVVSFDPETREFRDYGSLYDQNWCQYPRSIAADDLGWIYCGVGFTAGQILILDPRTGRAESVLPDERRGPGHGFVYRRNDGKVYGCCPESRDSWHVLYRGEAHEIERHEQADEKLFIAGSQNLFHRDFPGGSRLARFDCIERVVTIQNADGSGENNIKFDYTGDGAYLMGVAVAPDNTICGGSHFPMLFFSYDPAGDELSHRDARVGQWNAMGAQGDHFFVGGYNGGFLLDWDPAGQWVGPEKGDIHSNPRFLVDRSAPAIIRPHVLLAHPDGKTIVMAGTPEYGFTGGGMLFWSREQRTSVLLTDRQLIPDQSTFSLVALPDGKLLGGTTVAPGTGGEMKSSQAELYVIDMVSKEVEWRRVVLQGVEEYTDMHMTRTGLVFGFCDRCRFFVFDPESREIIHERNTSEEFGNTAYQQGPRVLHSDTDGTVYAIFTKCIAVIDQKTFCIKRVGNLPPDIIADADYPFACGGGDIMDGRIYFTIRSRVYSFKLPCL